MLDLIGTTILTAELAIILNTVVMTLSLSPAQKLTTVAAAGLWIGFAMALATTGIYAATAVPVLGMIVAAPLIVIGAMAVFSGSVRQTLLALPVPLLIGLNTLRILTGGFILLLAWQGRLSGPFPQSAGWGDVIVGVTAMPLLFAATNDLQGNRGAVLAWNILGTLDLVTALLLGVLSAPGSPLQRFGDAVGSTAMSSLPWSDIPTLHVPFYLIMHGIIFARLAPAGARVPA